jgi:murein L,D-transpeptidase YcbB/YkuD
MGRLRFGSEYALFHPENINFIIIILLTYLWHSEKNLSLRKMMMRLKFFILGAMILMAATFGSAQDTPVTPVTPQNLSTILQASFEHMPLGATKNNKQKELLNFYKLRHYAPVWIKDGAWTEAARNVLEVMRQADGEGLWSTDYYPVAEELMQLPLASSEAQVKGEIEFSKVVLDYIDDLFGGRLHPQRISKELYLNPEPVDESVILHEVLQRDPSANSLQGLTVPHPQYQALKKLLAQYTHQSIDEASSVLIPAGKIPKIGDKSNRIMAMRQRLANRGYLTPEQGTSQEFDAITEEALKRFQADHYLEADGKLGERTLIMLNRSKQDEIQQILVTMERWRWVPHDLGNRYVWVNIASYELKAYENGQIVLEMPVIIGRNFRRTPVFTSLIDQVRFNPTWHVPSSIAIKDKLPKLRSDPASFSAKDYVIYDEGGQVVDPVSVNWTEVDSSNFNYKLTQKPGPHNALGKIRFNIDNPFGVYLHSTPEKHLFKKVVRNFSSGCIRVGDPAALGVFVLNYPLQWPLDKVNKAMEGTETRNVPVDPPVKVYLTYFTIWIDEQGKARFYDDIYGQDATIWRALKNTKREVKLH